MKNFKKYLLTAFIYIMIGPILGTMPFIVLFLIIQLLTFSLKGIALYFSIIIFLLYVGYIIGGPAAFLAFCLKLYSMKTGKLNEVTRFLIMLFGCFFIVLRIASYNYPVDYALFLASFLCLPYCLLSMFAASACDAIIQKIENRYKKKSVS